VLGPKLISPGFKVTDCVLPVGLKTPPSYKYSVIEIKFTTGTPFIGYKRWEIQIESVGLKSKHFNDDVYYIENTVVPLSAILNGENIDVNEAINEYIDEFLPTKETYYESEEYYKEIDEIITKYPLLNADYVATYYDTKFIR
jgi:hypothetical protein